MKWLGRDQATLLVTAEALRSMREITDHHLNTETLPQERSSFLARAFSSLQDRIVSQGSRGWGGGGSRGGSASPPHHVCTQRLEGTAPAWPCSVSLQSPAVLSRDSSWTKH